jgi:hypothetical protein
MSEKDIERDDTYVAQLYQVFKSCDIFGNGLLGNDELFQLCMRLQLDDKQTNFIITNLIGNDLIAKVSQSKLETLPNLIYIYIFNYFIIHASNEFNQLYATQPNLSSLSSYSYIGRYFTCQIIHKTVLYSTISAQSMVDLKIQK